MSTQPRQAPVAVCVKVDVVLNVYAQSVSQAQCLLFDVNLEGERLDVVLSVVEAYCMNF